MAAASCLGDAEEIATGASAAGIRVGEYVLGTWRAAALSMAVIAPAAWYGLGALLGAAVMIPVIYALARLRRYSRRRAVPPS